MINQCPICHQDNKCGNSIDNLQTCWCTNKVFSNEVFQQIPEEHLYKQCICETCLHRITELEKASRRSIDR